MYVLYFQFAIDVAICGEARLLVVRAELQGRQFLQLLSRNIGGLNNNSLGIRVVKGLEMYTRSLFSQTFSSYFLLRLCSSAPTLENRRSTCQLQREVSGPRGSVLEMQLYRLCACLFEWSHFQITQRAHSSKSHPASCAVLQDSQNCLNCIPFVLFHTDRRWEMQWFRPFYRAALSPASHRTPSLAHMLICTPPVPPFVMSRLIPASITQLAPCLGIPDRLITFQEFNVMTRGQANFWSDKWWPKWLQSTGR